MSERNATLTESPVVRGAEGSTAQPGLPYTPADLRNEPNYPLWVRLRSGDRGARDELVIRYGPLVKYVLGRLAVNVTAAMDADDLLSAGTIGLLNAVDRYDPDQGVRFETYAQQRIRGAIIDSVRSLSLLSRGAGQRAKQLDEAAARLAQELNRAPTNREIANDLGIDLAQLDRMLVETSAIVVSLDRSTSWGEEDFQTLADVIHDPNQVSSSDILEEKESADRLAEAIALLSERDRLVLNLYYQEELTLKEIGRVLEVSESRVSQLHTAAILKLRALLRTQPLARAA